MSNNVEQKSEDTLTNDKIDSLIAELKKQKKVTVKELMERANRSTPIHNMMNKPIKSLLQRMEQNSRRLAQAGDRLNLSILDEQIKLSTAITIRASKEAHVLTEMKQFKDSDILIED